MRSIILISIIFGLIFSYSYVEGRANGHKNPISETSVEDDDASSEEFEKFRRATVSVLLDSDSEETTDQLLMRAKLLAYVDKLKAKEAKKKAKVEKKKAFFAAILAAQATPAPVTQAPTPATDDASTIPPNDSDEITVEVAKAARAVFNVTVSDSAESSDDLLMRAKLAAFVEKLKAKESKKTLKAKMAAEKANMKAEKEKAFIAMYLAATTPAPDTPAKRQAPASPPMSPADMLAQAKLNAYVAKLQAKQEKAQLKAQKKVAKEQMFMSYLAQAANASAPAAGTAPAAAPLPVMPFPGAIGLWNKSMFLNGLFTAMANANAAAAAAAVATTPQPIPVPVAAQTPASVVDDSEDEPAEISKRYAPSHNWDEESEEDDAEEDAEPAVEIPAAQPEVQRFRPKQHKAASPISARDQQILDFWAKYNKGEGVESREGFGGYPGSRRTDIGNRHKPGATNDFKTGPAGSPNGVGYAESPVSQAGCSGNHIHSCSGMTVYINKPEGEDDTTNDKYNGDESKAPARVEPKRKHQRHHKKDLSKRAAAAAKA